MTCTPVEVVQAVPVAQVRVRVQGLRIVDIHGCGHVNMTVAGHEATTGGVCVTPAGLGGCGHEATMNKHRKCMKRLHSQYVTIYHSQ